MRSITYVSSAVTSFGQPELVELLGRTRLLNERQRITGLLLYRDGLFVQVIEGPFRVVQATFDRIVDDPRHSEVFVVLNEQIRHRRFPDWSMGFENLTGRHLDDTPGWSAFLDDDLPGAFGDDALPWRILELFRATDPQGGRHRRMTAH